MRRITGLSWACSLLAGTLSASVASAKITFSHDPNNDIAAGIAANGGPQAIALVDLNRDHRADIVAVDTEVGEVDVFLNLNDNTGSIDQTGDSFMTDAGPVAVATGDFNRDGRLDIVTANSGAGTISVLLADATVAAPDVSYIDDSSTRDIPVDPHPIGVVAVDLDNDNILDLAVLSPGSVYLLKGDGKGNFTPFSKPSISTGGTGAFAIASGQFDTADTFPDLVVSDAGSGDLFVLHGNGDGTFKPAESISMGVLLAGGGGIAVADFNNDSFEDIADVSGSDVDVQLSLLLGDGSGGFQSPVMTDQPEVNSTVVTGVDLDADGHVDLVAANPGDGIGLQLFCNQPSTVCFDSDPRAPGKVGGFQLQLSIGTLGGAAAAVQAAVPCGSPARLGCGDINGDSLPDLIALDLDGSNIRVLLNTSLSTPGPTTPPTSATTVVTPTPTPTGPTATPTVTSTPSATFTLVPTATPTAVPAPWGVCNTSEDAQQPVWSQLVAVVTGDFDDNGAPDIAVADEQGNKIVILLSHLDLTPTPTPGASVECEVLALGRAPDVPVMAPVALAAVDLNADGNLDLAVAGAEGLSTFFGNGKGAFVKNQSYALPAGATPKSLAVGDFNHDGRLDVIVTDASNNSVNMFLGLGGGAFRDACPLNVALKTGFVVAQDLSAGGRPDDFAVTGDQAPNISVFLRAGSTPTGTPQPTATPVPSATPACLTIADFAPLSPLDTQSPPRAFIAELFDRSDTVADFAAALPDGRLLIIVGRPASGGKVNYDSPRAVVVPSPSGGSKPLPSALGAGLINHDRIIDLVVADQNNDDVVALLGAGDGTFPIAAIPAPVRHNTPGATPAPAHPLALTLDDMDLDGQPDVVTANADGSVSVLISSHPPPTPTSPPTASPTITLTGTPTGTPTSTQIPTTTLSPTVTATGTRTRPPTATPTAQPTATLKVGAISLNGSCALEPNARSRSWLTMVAWLAAAAAIRALRRVWR